jgi:D-lactate dehydrogenase
MREKITMIKLYEPVEFIETFLIDRLEFHRTDTPIAVHTTCTTTKMHLAPLLLRLAQRCSSKVLVPQEVGCCGFAGDKGFTHPKINAYALRKLPLQLKAAHIQVGYSNSRTCEIGLSTNARIPYVSIVYLVDACTSKKWVL